MKLPDHVVEAMAAQFAKQSPRIAQELCSTVGTGSPSHPRLLNDVKNAAFCALHSETFRALVVAIESEALLGTLDASEARGDDNEMAALRRAKHCVDTLITAFRQAEKIGGAGAKMHVGDCIKVIEEFQKGTMDKGAPITGPFYDQSVQ